MAPPKDQQVSREEEEFLGEERITVSEDVEERDHPPGSVPPPRIGGSVGDGRERGPDLVGFLLAWPPDRGAVPPELGEGYPEVPSAFGSKLRAQKGRDRHERKTRRNLVPSPYLELAPVGERRVCVHEPDEGLFTHS